MKWIVLLLTAALASVGCSGQRKASIPAGKFKVTLLSRISGEDILVRHYRIEAAGSHTVEVTEGKGDLQSARIDPAVGRQDMVGDLYFVAALSPVDKTEFVLKWLVKIENAGGGAGGGSTFRGQDAGGLDEILKIALPEGEHPLGAPISLGHLQENEIVLNVK